LKIFNGRRLGVSFENFCLWIATVKSGKRAIIHGPEYVVMSRNIYEELVKPPEPIIFEDELKPPPAGGDRP
jgi:hypothetical protein